MKYYTYEEINKHNTADDCWLIAGDKVYNVTQFLKLHPQHTERIMKYIGEDVKKHYDFHTQKQHEQWSKYFIGKTIDTKSECSIQ
jgi:nitrate reductase (NAD(P)H)